MRDTSEHFNEELDTDKEHNNHHNQHSTTHNLQDEHRKYVEESEKRAQRLRQLLESAETERRDLAAKLENERRKVEELEFRIEEESIGKDDLEMGKDKERQKIEDLERRLQQEVRKNEMIATGASPDSVLKEESIRVNDELKAVREKLRQSEAKIKELQTIKPAITHSQFVLVEARIFCFIGSTSQGGRAEEERGGPPPSPTQPRQQKREIQNLLDRVAELERELQKSKSRQTKQLDTIDDMNIKLQKFESKCSNLEEELHSAKEKTEELERRLRASSEQVALLETEKKKVEEQLLTPESTSKEQAILARLEERERDVSKWRKEAECARCEADKFREEREKMRKETEEKIRVLNEEHQEESRKEKKKAMVGVEFMPQNEDAQYSKIRELENLLSEVRVELESARVEAETRLSRQEARLREAELRTDTLDQLREQISKLQAEKELLKVEREESWKRLQISEQSRTRWESEAGRASAEVNLLKSQVHHLRTEFTTHKEDLIKKLAETRFDAEAVQELHTQIEEQRNVLEELQHRLKHTEGERDQLKTVLNTNQQTQTQVENGLRQDVDTLRRRLSQAETINESLKEALKLPNC
ncbi:hypothetical protein CEXT_131361 [Caerostris extrusa]|uniref:Uncharacterized protein n=1 Tax=Caerostris extrusa TaxID=172846 RepID=A0AAV4N9T1_CAEEX|nr:hypothetical protein CEXT_131361 [Caerostris extrusa]